MTRQHSMPEEPRDPVPGPERSGMEVSVRYQGEALRNRIHDLYERYETGMPPC
jgi:hypothetical protein